MTVVQQLYDLLGVDEDIGRHNQTIASLDAALADTQRLVETRQAVEETRDTLRKQQTERRDLEMTVDASQTKAGEVEAKLYGGIVRNPRELEDLQTELNLLRAQQKRHEETLLQSLEGVEETEGSLVALETTLEEMESSWQQDEARMLDERSNLQKDLAQLQKKRDGMSALVSPVHLSLYDTLRSTRQGLAVVKVERGSCQGCRITLPTRVVQQARTSPEPVKCPSCSRILYVS